MASTKEKAEGQPNAECVYTAAELALRLAGKEAATLSEARQIIERFKKKEVK